MKGKNKKKAEKKSVTAVVMVGGTVSSVVSAIETAPESNNFFYGVSISTPEDFKRYRVTIDDGIRIASARMNQVAAGNTKCIAWRPDNRKTGLPSAAAPYQERGFSAAGVMLGDVLIEALASFANSGVEVLFFKPEGLYRADPKALRAMRGEVSQFRRRITGYNPNVFSATVKLK